MVGFQPLKSELRSISLGWGTCVMPRRLRSQGTPSFLTSTHRFSSRAVRDRRNLPNLLVFASHEAQQKARDPRYVTEKMISVFGAQLMLATELSAERMRFIAASL